VADGPHLVVCKNPKALEHLKNELCLIGFMSEKGKSMAQGDALVARDELQEAGFKWGQDFYLKVVT
jgi:hypothetical protein